MSGCEKVQCNVLAISIIYNGATEGFECGFPCFLPDYDAIFHARKIAKRIVLFSCFTQFWACNEADEPHFSALYTPKLHLCTLIPMSRTPFPHIPKPHLGYPISPFWVFYGAFMLSYWHLFYPSFRLCFPNFLTKMRLNNHILILSFEHKSDTSTQIYTH